MASRRGGGAISAEALAVLRAAEIVDNKVHLRSGVLPRALYVEVNEVLERLGGKWTGRRVLAHVFEWDPTEALASVTALGVVPAMPPRNVLDFFETPLALACKIVRERIAPIATIGMRVLEPSAGKGSFARALQVEIMEALDTPIEIDCVELDATRAAGISQHQLAHRVFVADFLAWEGPEGADGVEYDAIIMNPPFTAPENPLAYIDHVQHAYTMLRPGGTLVAICPSGLQYRQDRRPRALRDFVESIGGEIIPLPADAFVESGTGAQTVLVTLEAQAEQSTAPLATFARAGTAS